MASSILIEYEYFSDKSIRTIDGTLPINTPLGQIGFESNGNKTAPSEPCRLGGY